MISIKVHYLEGLAKTTLCGLVALTRYHMELTTVHKSKVTCRKCLNALEGLQTKGN